MRNPLNYLLARVYVWRLRIEPRIATYTTVLIVSVALTLNLIAFVFLAGSVSDVIGAALFNLRRNDLRSIAMLVGVLTFVLVQWHVSSSGGLGELASRFKPEPTSQTRLGNTLLVCYGIATFLLPFAILIIAR